MIYIGRKGMYDLNLSTRTTQLIVSGKIADVIVGTKTRRVFYVNYLDGRNHVVDIDTKVVTELPALLLRGQVSSVNADETLLVGTQLEALAHDLSYYKLKATVAVNQVVQAQHQKILDEQRAAANSPRPVPDPNYDGAKPLADTDAAVKADHDALAAAFVKADADAIQQRFAAHSPESIFTLNLKNGTVSTILQGTDWLNHVQFSPTDPDLILYAHDGPPLSVDRVWTMHADGSANHLRNTRSDPSEATTQEFWSRDGKTVWFDLQNPNGENFALAGIEVATGARTTYRLTKVEASVHYNVSVDGTLFCGDGNLTAPSDPGGNGPSTLDRKWIELLRPNADGTFHSTRLAHLTANDYARNEPGIRFTPDNKMVIFTSNMFGPTYVFGVEVAKAAQDNGAGE